MSRVAGRRTDRARKGRILALVAGVVALQATALLAAILLGGGPSPARTDRAGEAQGEAHEPASAPADTGDAQGEAHERHEPLADEMLYTYDIEDERIVIGLSENVFTGRVERMIGREPATTTIPDDPGRPQAQFAVRVLGAAKSTGPRPVAAGETVAVNQEMGRDQRTGRIIPIEAAFCGRHLADEALEAGGHYLFATYYESDRKLHTLTAQPAGAVPAASAVEADTLLAAYERYEEAQVDPATGKIQGAKPCE